MVASIPRIAYMKTCVGEKFRFVMNSQKVCHRPYKFSCLSHILSRLLTLRKIKGSSSRGCAVSWGFPSLRFPTHSTWRAESHRGLHVKCLLF